MAIMDERSAWRILGLYSGDCAEIDQDSLMAVYAVGSLPAGYYRPGQSDIDAVLIVRDGSEAIWGNTDTPSDRLAVLNGEYKRRYAIPKDFGPFPLQPRELYPPYDAGKELTLEIARLKVQGKCVYGAFPIDDIPMPTTEDYRRDFRHFEEYWDNDFSKKTPLEKMSAVQCVNTILMHLRRYLIVETGILDFDKRRIVPLCMANNAPFLSKSALDLVQRHLGGHETGEEEMETLRQYVVDLRYNMNTFLNLC